MLSDINIANYYQIIIMSDTTLSDIVISEIYMFDNIMSDYGRGAITKVPRWGRWGQKLKTFHGFNAFNIKVVWHKSYRWKLTSVLIWDNQSGFSLNPVAQYIRQKLLWKAKYYYITMSPKPLSHSLQFVVDLVPAILVSNSVEKHVTI